MTVSHVCLDVSAYWTPQSQSLVLLDAAAKLVLWIGYTITTDLRLTSTGVLQSVLSVFVPSVRQL